MHLCSQACEEGAAEGTGGFKQACVSQALELQSQGLFRWPVVLFVRCSSLSSCLAWGRTELLAPWWGHVITSGQNVMSRSD